MLEGALIKKEIILVGNKRTGESSSELSQTVRDTEAIKTICFS